MRRVPPARRKSSQYAQSPSSIQKVQPSCSKSSEHLQPAYKIPGSARVSSSVYRARCLRAVNVAVFAPDVTSGASPPAHRDWCQGTERAEPDLCFKHLNGGFFLENRPYLHIVAPKRSWSGIKVPCGGDKFCTCQTTCTCIRACRGTVPWLSNTVCRFIPNSVMRKRASLYLG